MQQDSGNEYRDDLGIRRVHTCTYQKEFTYHIEFSCMAQQICIVDFKMKILAPVF